MSEYDMTVPCVALAYDGQSDMVRGFLRQMHLLTDAIDTACGNYRGDEGAYKNHALDALQSLVGNYDEDWDANPISHVLGFEQREFIERFGRMTFVRAAVKEFGLDDAEDIVFDVVGSYQAGRMVGDEEVEL